MDQGLACSVQGSGMGIRNSFAAANLTLYS